MAVVTFGIRYPVLAFFDKLNFPPLVQKALRFVPVAVLSALAAPMVLIANGEWFISIENAALVGSLLALLVAFKTRHLLLTIVIGMIAFLAVRVFWL